MSKNKLHVRYDLCQKINYMWDMICVKNKWDMNDNINNLEMKYDKWFIIGYDKWFIISYDSQCEWFKYDMLCMIRYN